MITNYLIKLKSSQQRLTKKVRDMFHHHTIDYNDSFHRVLNSEDLPLEVALRIFLFALFGVLPLRDLISILNYSKPLDYLISQVITLQDFAIDAFQNPSKKWTIFDMDENRISGKKMKILAKFLKERDLSLETLEVHTKRNLSSFDKLVKHNKPLKSIISASSQIDLISSHVYGLSSIGKECQIDWLSKVSNFCFGCCHFQPSHLQSLSNLKEVTICGTALLDISTIQMLLTFIKVREGCPKINQLTVDCRSFITLSKLRSMDFSYFQLFKLLIFQMPASDVRFLIGSHECSRYNYFEPNYGSALEVLNDISPFIEDLDFSLDSVYLNKLAGRKWFSGMTKLQKFTLVGLFQSRPGDNMEFFNESLTNLTIDPTNAIEIPLSFKFNHLPSLTHLTLKRIFVSSDTFRTIPKSTHFLEVVNCKFVDDELVVPAGIHHLLLFYSYPKLVFEDRSSEMSDVLRLQLGTTIAHISDAYRLIRDCSLYCSEGTLSVYGHGTVRIQTVTQSAEIERGKECLFIEYSRLSPSSGNHVGSTFNAMITVDRQEKANNTIIYWIFKGCLQAVAELDHETKDSYFAILSLIFLKYYWNASICELNAP
ncbi:unnamed protein product [Ambrosiozyma monospora]|uniref:Unnamed protein product n=1 Tax=Ambrosiozyma monospora TaxID=43982 RepID=A0ACB5SY86_AMBMO|nr:unnamed protein product [Ambrosiozyma monospora]